MEVVEIKQNCNSNTKFYTVFDFDKVHIGNFVLSFYGSTIYLEYINRHSHHKGYGLLPKVVEWIFDNFNFKILVTNPLEPYVSYYESLGFKKNKKSNYYGKENK